MPPAKQDFEEAMKNKIRTAIDEGLPSIMINSGELHGIVGGYPGPDHRMPLCCQVMRESMREGDTIIQSPPSGQGATLIIEYKLRQETAQAEAESLTTLLKTNKKLVFDIVGLIIVCFMFFGVSYGNYVIYEKIITLEATSGEIKRTSVSQVMLALLYGLGGKWLVVGLGCAVSLSMLWIAFDEFRGILKNVTKT